MNKKTVSIIVSSILYVCLSAILIFILMKSGTYPDGENTMFHIYRADTLLNNIRNGNFFLWYDFSLYNGVELLRYFGVLPAYFMAFIEWLVGGNATSAYLVTTSLIFFLSAEEMFLISLKQDEQSVIKSFLMGILWFFFPMNLYIWFREGDLAGGMAVLLIIPVLYYNIKKCIKYGYQKNYISLVLLTWVLALTEETYTMMYLMILLMLLMILLFFGRGHKRVLMTLFASLLGIGIASFWFLPSITGNIQYGVSTEALANSFQSLLISLNPVNRIQTDNAYMYIGIGSVLLALFQLLFSKNENKASALCFLLICFFSSSFCYVIIQHFYFSSLFKMLNMCAIASALLIVDFCDWITLKRIFNIVIIFLLVLDAIPSLSLVYGEWTGLSDEKRMNMEEEYTWITEAKSNSKNRIALMDNSKLSSMGTWLISSNQEHGAVFGSGWTASSTRQNTRMLNEAMQNGNYLYMFDRLFSYGADTVIVRVDQLKTGDAEDIEKLDAAATMLGYQRTKKNQDYRLYVNNVNSLYGTKDTYQYLAIGTDAENICETFPAFELADSNDLSSYSFDELKKYKVIYLSGFTYENRQNAEELIKNLSESGIRIIISADGIPEDPATHHQNFLDLECQPVQFKYGFPDMNTVNGMLETKLFPADKKNWDTVYVNGLDNILGSVTADDSVLPFFGTVKNDDIYVIGFRLTQFYGLTGDEGIGKLLSKAFDVSNQELPTRVAVDLKVKQNATGMEIISKSGSDITIPYAYATCMKITGDYTIHNSLIVMKQDKLSIRYGLNKNQIIGMIISVLSIILMVYLGRFCSKEVEV